MIDGGLIGEGLAMPDEEFLQKIADIEELPISEEMLGAYLEGNLTESQELVVNNVIDSFPQMSSIVEEISLIETTESLFVSDFDLPAELFSIISDIGLPLSSYDALNNSPTPFLEYVSLIPPSMDYHSFEVIKHLDAPISDTSISDPDSSCSPYDSFITSSESIESNDNSDSILDNNMFDSNLDF